jgi:hypothetical protein
VALGDSESVQVSIVRKWTSFSGQHASGRSRTRLQESSSAGFHGKPPRRPLKGEYTTTDETENPIGAAHIEQEGSTVLRVRDSDNGTLAQVWTRTPCTRLPGQRNALSFRAERGISL